MLEIKKTDYLEEDLGAFKELFENVKYLGLTYKHFLK